MNKERRAELKKAAGKLDEGWSVLSAIIDEEQEAFDNLPESIQSSERGEKMEEIIELLQEITDQISEYIEELENV